MLSVLVWAIVVQKPAVFDAARQGDTATVKRYLDAGGDPNAREPKKTLPSAERNDPGGSVYSGDTLLMLAIDAQTVGLVDLLLSRKADPNRAGEQGWTPLMRATSRSNADLVRRLLKAGAKTEARNGFGDTALTFAANDGSLEIARLLVQKGASLRGGTGWTPLMHAAYNGQATMVQFLLKRGADPNQHPPGFMSPLECAVAQGYDGIATMLVKRGATGDLSKLRQARQDRQTHWDQQRVERERAIRSVIPTPMTNEDATVIEAAMRAFMEERAAQRKERSIPELRLGSETLGITGGWSDDWINSQLEPKRAQQIGLDLRRDLFIRNRGITDLSKMRPKPGIVVTSAKTFSRRDYDRPYAITLLPGYSKAHDQALVDFSFGPTAHGAHATVLLAKQAGVWKAQWCETSYYV